CYLVCIAVLVVDVQGLCNTCQQTNSVRCLNQTHFGFCSSNIAEDQVGKCPEGEVCTKYKSICMPDSPGLASCQPNEAVNCPSCDGSQLFVCTSRTTFQMCNGNTLSSQVTQCKDNTYCSISTNTFCVDSCQIKQTGYQCDRESP
ncbi:hypothetical protein KR018_003087, partial [Drosophila ironensis]